MISFDVKRLFTNAPREKKANVFMASVEENLIPILKSFLCHWKRYVDDVHAYVEPTKV